MDPLTISIWIIIGLASTTTITASVLFKKLKLLKNKQSAEEKEKDTQISDLTKNAISLRSDLAKTKSELKTAKREIEDLQSRDESLNKELRQLKNVHKSVGDDRDRLHKEKTTQKETILRQEQKLEQANAQYSELHDKFRQTEQQLYRLQNTNQGVQSRIQEVQSVNQALSNEKEINQETITRQQQELEQAIAQRSELRKTLREKEQCMQELKENNQRITAEIRELESYQEKLKQENEAKQKIISEQRGELEQTLNKNSELQDTLQEKEQDVKHLQENQQQVQQLQDINQEMSIKIQELQAKVAELNQEKEENQESITQNEQELKQAIAQSSKLQDTLKKKEEYIKELKDQEQHIQVLKSNITELTQEKQKNQEIIAHKEDELKQVITQISKLKDSLKEKDEYINKLRDVDNTMRARLKQAQSLIQGLDKEMQPEDKIIPEPKIEKDIQIPQPEKEVKAQKNQEPESTPTPQDKIVFTEMENKKEKRLIEVLLVNNLITKEALHKALKLKDKFGGNLLQFLIINKDIDEDQLAACLSDQFKNPYLPLDMYEISNEIVELLPCAIAQKYWLLPVDKIKNNLMIVMVDPSDHEAIKEVEKSTGCTVKVYVGRLSEIAKEIQRLYKVNIQGLDAKGNRVSPFFIKQDDYEGRERRKSIRFKLEIPLKITFENNKLITHSETEDISWEGISFKLDHDLPIEATLKIQLSKPGALDKKGDQAHVKAVAQVKRATRIKKNNFLIGAQLLKASKDDLSDILEYASRN